MSSLLFWQGRNGKGNAPAGGATAGTGGSQNSNTRTWLHAPDLLLKGHVAYLVKYLGSTAVDQPKGIEVVKDAIRRLQFTQQLRKSETGAKSKKVEITISVDGVAIQEPRTNNILHQFPLHRISYCADDKEAKKYFSFIAKSEGLSPTSTNGDSNGSISNGSVNGSTAGEQHECFVFVSNKLASEITLTIGQAFDLAYRRFLMERGAGAEAVGQEAARAKAQATEMANRAKELAALLPAAELKVWLSKKGITHPTEWNPEPDVGSEKQINGISKDSIIQTSPFSNNHMEDLMSTSIDSSPSKNPSVGTKLEGLLLNSDSDSDFDPRASESDPPAVTIQNSPKTPLSQTPTVQNGYTPPPLLAPPPKTSKRLGQPQNGNMNGNGFHNGTDDLFGSSPFSLPTVNEVCPPPPAMLAPVLNNSVHQQSSVASSNTPNYNLSDFNLQTSIFTSNSVTNTHNGNGFTNGTSGMVGFDPFDTNKFNNFSTSNGFSNPMGFSNGFNNFPFGEKQSSSTLLDSNFSGFLDKRVTEMKDGFSRGLVTATEDFSTLDPFRK